VQAREGRCLEGPLVLLRRHGPESSMPKGVRRLREPAPTIGLPEATHSPWVPAGVCFPVCRLVPQPGSIHHFLVGGMHYCGRLLPGGRCGPAGGSQCAHCRTFQSKPLGVRQRGSGGGWHAIYRPGDGGALINRTLRTPPLQTLSPPPR
jgi:hypothetical protein